MKKIVTILGARPQFIKAAMVSRLLKNESDCVQEVIVHTGQHFDLNMSEIFFHEMKIPEPKHNLGISGGNHGAMTGKMIIELEKILLQESPDLVLVYGDTNSTLAGALVSRKLNIPVAHVEAGLRNFDMSVPEDVNRILTDRISSLLFCPTDIAITNLTREGFKTFPCTIVKTGDLMVDAVRFYAKLSPTLAVPKSVSENNYVLCTIHRAHNTTIPGIYETFAALNKIAETTSIIFPIHPRTKKALEQYGIKLNSSIQLIPPQGYLNMISLLTQAEDVITDSGGLQKEAYALGKRSLLLMDFTPWEELVYNEFSVVTRINRNDIIESWNKLRTLSPNFSKQLYGDGKTSEDIVSHIKDFLLQDQN